MSERLTDEEYRAWIDAGSPNELEGWAIILALRAWVAKLEAALKRADLLIMDGFPDGAHVEIRAALKDAP